MLKDKSKKRSGKLTQRKPSTIDLSKADPSMPSHHNTGDTAQVLKELSNQLAKVQKENELLKDSLSRFVWETIESDLTHSPLPLSPLCVKAQNRLSTYANNLFIRQFVSDCGGIEGVSPLTGYAVYFGNGPDFGCRYYPECESHADAHGKVLLEYKALGQSGPTLVEVVGPWTGDPNIAPVGNKVSVRWKAELFAVEEL